jgi:predicted nuclease of predicted toxin-antitoxin system
VKLKLDENLGGSARDELVQAGLDVATVPGQSLASATDESLIEACRAEGRALVTLDLDFANPLRFPPDRCPGIAVLRPPPQISAAALLALVRTLAAALAKESLAGRLWIVEIGRIRVHETSEREGD